MNNQQKRPLFDALFAYSNSEVVPFDVPGHKMGKGIHPDFKKIVGEQILKMDVNSSPKLDILSNPSGVIKEAEKLAAELFEADYAYFLVNGSTSGIQNMMMAVLKPNDKIILPRNIHKSAINGLVLTGAIPVFIQPEIEPTLGFAVGNSVKDTIDTINKNPDAKVILLLNPTYYGFTNDIKSIIDYAHQKGLIVLVDESHGTHFTFDNRFGTPSIKAGADITTISVHKTGGSFTQSSIMLLNKGLVNDKELRSSINVLQTSSASYLLMASLDMARFNLATNPHLIKNVYTLSKEATKKINNIPGLKAMENHMTLHKEEFQHDVSKLIIDVHKLGLTGHEAYEILRTQYNIQCEVGETNIVLAIISIGDTPESINKLIHALNDMASNYSHVKPNPFIRRSFFKPTLVLSPREAFFKETEYVPITKAVGKIAGDQIMIYPPGIPLLIPGERITKEIITEYKRLYDQGNILIGSVFENAIQIKVIKED